MYFASQPFMRSVRTTSSELAERRARLRRFEAACEQFRNGGVSDERNAMKWVLKLELSLIQSRGGAAVDRYALESSPT